MGAPDRFDRSVLPPGTTGPLADPDEIDRYEAAIAGFRAGVIPEDRFTAMRLQQGCYGQRQSGVNMLRIKAPGGKLDAAKLDAIAAVVERHSQAGQAHLTTRESIQIHSVALDQTPDAMRMLARAGLTTREACGNTVRNITACGMAGACALEHTDVNQHIDRAVVHFLRNPLNQQLPRKFKVSFSGCERDCAQGLLHDLAVIAGRRDGEPGFRLMAGGGLGHKPREAILVREFVPEAELLAAMEAIIELHEKHSDRSKRAKSRIKFLVDRFGAEGFVARFDEAFERARAAHAATPLPPQQWRTPVVGRAPGPGAPREPLAQRQPGLFAVPVSVPLGHLPAAGLRGLAASMRAHGLDDIRTTQDQNLVIRNVPGAKVMDIVAGLGAIGLALPRAGDDVVACPGTSTCRLGITASQSQAARLGSLAGDLRIRVSGCHNGCAQPETGDIGIYGEGRRMHGRLVPHYQLYLGGDGMAGGRLARKGPSVPVARVEAAIDRIAAAFRDGRVAGQRFLDWVHAQADDHFDTMLADIVDVRADDLEDVLRDVDGETEFRVAQLGGGECAGASQVFIGAAFFAAAHERRYRDAFVAQGRTADAAACAAASLRLIGQGLIDLVNPAPSFRVRRVLTDLSDIAEALAGKVPDGIARAYAAFAGTLADGNGPADAPALFAAIDAWVRATAALCVERDPQIDLNGALPGTAVVVPIRIRRREPVPAAAD
ncbi:sulfite reductase (ferredoxin) [Burkholderiales bacterium]|nr:sulfite reductase (ferredoxin) [Burkholderiales bacterium]